MFTSTTQQLKHTVQWDAPFFAVNKSVVTLVRAIKE